MLQVLPVRAHEPVPPEECGRVVTREVIVMEVMEACPCVAGDEVEGVDVGDVVTTVHVYRLHQAECHPRPHHHHVTSHQQDTNKETKTKN